MNSYSDEIDVDPTLELNLGKKVKVQVVTIHGLNTEKIPIVENLTNNLYNVKTFGETCVQTNLVCESLNKIGAFKSVSTILDIEKGPTSVSSYLSDSFKVDNPYMNPFVSTNTESDVIPMAIRIEAQKYRKISGKVGTFFGNKDNNLSASVNLNNVGALGSYISLIASYGQNTKSSFEAIYSRILGLNPNNRIDFFLNRNTIDFCQSSFKELCHSFGSRITTKSNYGDHSFGCKMLVRYNSNFTPFASLFTRLQAGFSTKYSLDHSFTKDNRNDTNFPSSGYLFKAFQELCSFSEVSNHLKLETSFQSFHKFLKHSNMIYSPSLSLGLIHTFGDGVHKTMINDRFFIGGPYNLRGFVAKSIGNHSKNDYVGGDIFWMLANHLYFLLPNTSSTEGIGQNVRGHLFACVGGIQPKNNDQSTANMVGNIVQTIHKNYRLSLGMGLLINITGSAKLEINLAYPVGLNSDSYKRGLQFGIGVDFL